MTIESRGLRGLSAVTVVAVLALGTAACGKKGDPMPPIRPIPATADDFEVIQRGDRLLLSGPYPSTTVAGTPLSEVTGASVWAVVRTVPAGAELPPSLEPRQFDAAAQPLRTLEGADLEGAVRGSRIDLALTLDEVRAEVAALPEEVGEEERPVATLGFKTRGPTGEESAVSNLVTLPVAEAPAPPTRLTVEGEPRGVRLRWEYPEEAEAPTPQEPPQEPDPEEPVEEEDGAEAGESETAEGAPQDGSEKPEEGEGGATEETDGAGAEDGEDGGAGTGEGEDAETAEETEPEEGGIRGFHVYRRAANERSYGRQPLRTLPRRARTFVDESALFGQSYIYAVTAVAERRPVVIESGLGQEVEVIYRDRFPPATPTGVVALFQEGTGDEDPDRVRVVWRPVDAPDLAGYRVYRQDPESGELRPLHDEPTSRTELVDEDVAAGRTYTYQVRSVDRAGNESEPSEPAAATIR